MMQNIFKNNVFENGSLTSKIVEVTSRDVISLILNYVVQVVKL